MKRPPRIATAVTLLCALAQAACAQTPPAAARSAAPDGTTVSALDAELFYQLLLGELNARGAEPSAGYSLVLDAARRTNDPELYQRAVEIAFQSRSGDAALQAARAWAQAHPSSRDANRFVLQILLALNRVAESVEPLKRDIALANAPERNAALAAVPRYYARVSDKKLAASVVEQALADALAQPATAAAAWTTIGRLRLAADDTAGALEAARRGQAAAPQAEGPALLGLELMEPRLPQAESLVRTYLQGQPLPELRLGYARALLDAHRYSEASEQIRRVTTDKPEIAEAWLIQGTLQLQDSQLPAAETSLKRYIALAQAQRTGEERSRGLAQAYLALAQVAEKRKDFAQANAWLDRIDNAQDLVSAQSRRASLLAQQGRLEEGRKLLRALPGRTPAEARMKLMAEVQLLRDNKQYKPAYDLLMQAAAKDPSNAELLYDQAMLAEKLGNLPEMEKLLRQVIAIKPDFHHAYNALGYSLADRNIRLPESKQLIQKALEYAPGDPFISDSLAWVEFRMGNRAEALRILEAAYTNRPDAEIAAHLGEVLWSMGQRDRAQAIWKEGLLLNAENETLLETLKRFRVRP
ncbi:tetratricopeptide repeat protein [Ramlibacter tataouinensis]|nr:tetratricopeptide repeat protein [Ramlibacter tataouinensis]